MQALKMVLGLNDDNQETIVSAEWQRDSEGNTTPVKRIVDPHSKNPIEMEETISTDELWDQISNGDYCIIDIQAIPA